MAPEIRAVCNARNSKGRLVEERGLRVGWLGPGGLLSAQHVVNLLCLSRPQGKRTQLCVAKATLLGAKGVIASLQLREAIVSFGVCVGDHALRPGCCLKVNGRIKNRAVLRVANRTVQRSRALVARCAPDA